MPPSANLDSLKDGASIHLSGIGGSAMNGLALILKHRGFVVTGTDPAPSTSARAHLDQLGIVIHAEQDGSRVPVDASLLIATAALGDDNGDILTAKKRGVPVVKYAGALGALMSSSCGIAVAGTHGKTTTSAMLVSAMRAGGIDPGFIIGAHVNHLSGSAGVGGSDWFVAEACEYNRSFLNLYPRLGIVTNIDADHLDTYGGIEDIRDAFGEFASRIPESGALICDVSCPNTAMVAKNLECEIITCSVEGSGRYVAEKVQIDDERTRFVVAIDGVETTQISLLMPGRHNISNAVMAFAAAHEAGVAPDAIARGLGDLGAIGRRFELVGEKRGVQLVDDYAHHPTEIRAMLSAAISRYPDRRIFVAFQPHQISRTRLLFDDFAAAFGGASRVYVSDVFSARDRGETGPSDLARDLTNAMANSGTRATHIPTLGKIAETAASDLRPGDVFISVGAGDVNQLGKMLLELL